MRRVLDINLSSRIRATARRFGVTSAAIFHAAWALVVARTSGRDDVVFGSVLLGRLQRVAGADELPGMFINTLPLRVDLRRVDVRQLVHRTQRELISLLEYEHAPLMLAQRCSEVGAGRPLFSSLLNYRHSETRPAAIQDEAEISGIEILGGRERTNYPFVMSIDDLGEGFSLLSQTDRRVAPSRAIAYFCTALESLITSLESAPEARCLDLEVLPTSERQEVVETFNATKADYPQDALVHELFEAQAQRRPDAVALEFEGRQVTYGELNRRSNQLARYLRKHADVGPDECVRLCCERGVELRRGRARGA